MNTTQLGTAKLIVGAVVLVVAVLFGIIGKDWTTAAAIAGIGGTLAGGLSGLGLIKAQDATVQNP